MQEKTIIQRDNLSLKGNGLSLRDDQSDEIFIDLQGNIHSEAENEFEED